MLTWPAPSPCIQPDPTIPSMILCCGDVEQNPGPDFKREIQQNTRDPPEYQEHHQIPSNSGTSTVVFETRNVRNKLSLSRNNSRRIPGSTPYVSLFSDEYIQLDSDSGDELPDPAESSRIPNLCEELVTLKSKLHVADDGNKITKFNINRHDVMDGARRAINRKSFCPRRKMSVKFTDDIGSPEGAVDEGALSSGAYKDAGTIIAMSIVHGGPAPKFFNQLLFDMMVGRKVHPTLEDVQDIDMKGKIKKLKDCTNLEDIDLNLSSAGLSTIMNISGSGRPVRNLEDRDFLVQDLLHFVVVGRVTEALSQLTLGLKTLGLYDRMKENPAVFEEVFLNNSNAEIAAATMEAIFVDITFSLAGSNRRKTEEKIVGFWRDFLLDIEENSTELELNLSEVLAFTTGADSVPLLGFDPSPSITFTECGRFPRANTCAMEIALPLNVTPFEEFKESMIFGIKNSPGFGKA
ncbi:G2/M phase-specific E3 ubiquitin-protein ligase-like isoform X5 [Argopecten irradians]|uniref:G2/M phase-specific E3 ubiquitin-protein ligase-like isoform X5 n=1 Tax=Argopecten irradians TaxID=31199 RepID=UPI0037239F60